MMGAPDFHLAQAEHLGRRLDLHALMRREARAWELADHFARNFWRLCGRKINAEINVAHSLRLLETMTVDEAKERIDAIFAKATLKKPPSMFLIDCDVPSKAQK